MRMSAKIITALSVTGLAVAAGSAFTGGGLTNGAGESQFIGGAVNQSVTGATLDSLVYGFGADADGTNKAVKEVTLTFAPGAEGKTVDLVLTHGAGLAASFICPSIVDNTSVCSGDAQNVTNAKVTVNN